MRHAARRDENEPELVALARTLGAWMIKLHEPTDWLMWYRGRWEPVEIKDPSVQGHANEFTMAQRTFRVEAFKRGVKLIVWRTREDVLKTCNARVSA